MAVTVTDLTTLDGDPLIRGTCDTDARITLEIDAGASGIDTFNTVAYGGEWMVKTANPFEIAPTVIKSKDTGGVRAGNTYNIHPVLIDCHNGDRLIFYTNGTDHISKEDIIVSKRSTDKGITWGAETLVLENPDYISEDAGARKNAAVIDPDTGRIIVWALVRKNNASNFLTLRFGYIYSDDHGYTWSSFINVYPDFAGYPQYFMNGGPDLIAFSQACKTSLGLVMPMYAIGNATYLLVSTDNGLTWPESNVITVDNYTGSANINEPHIVQIDQDRLVIIARNEDLDKQFCYWKTSDGGATWTTRSPMIDYTNASTPQGAAPITPRKIGNQIHSWFVARRNDSRGSIISHTRVGLEAFFEDPSRAFDPNTTYPNSRQSNFGVVSSWYLNVGYADIAPLPDYPYTSLCAYYDQNPSGSEYETDIVIETMPRALP